MTLSQAVLWFAERAQIRHSTAWLQRHGVKRWQLDHLQELGIVSYTPYSDDRYLLDWKKYQPKTQRVA